MCEWAAGLAHFYILTAGNWWGFWVSSLNSWWRADKIQEVWYQKCMRHREFYIKPIRCWYLSSYSCGKGNLIESSLSCVSPTRNKHVFWISYQGLDSLRKEGEVDWWDQRWYLYTVSQVWRRATPTTSSGYHSLTTRILNRRRRKALDYIHPTWMDREYPAHQGSLYDVDCVILGMS